MKIHVIVPMMIILLLASLTLALAEGTYKQVQHVLDTTMTVMDEKLTHMDGSSLHVTSMIVTIAPGEATGWHKHGVPLYIYVLSGEVTVDYGENGIRTVGGGGSFMEAMDVWHRGTNQSKEPVQILAVYMGSDKARNVIPRE